MTKERKGTDLLRGLNDIPEEWIEKCYEENVSVTKEHKTGNGVRERIFRKATVRWAVAAMTVILMCGCGVAYAAKLGILQFTKSEDKVNPGFSLTAKTEHITAEELTGEIHEVEGFLRDYMAEEDYRQKFPSWLKQFETVEEARAYIGYEGMKETNVPGTIEEVNVRVIGDTEGNLGEVSLFVRAEEGDIYINETSAVFTEESPISLHGTGIRHSRDYLEGVRMAPDYRSEEYITASGKTAVFVYEEKVSGNRWLLGAVVDGAMYYELSIYYYPKDFKRAKELLIQWCEQF